MLLPVYGLCGNCLCSVLSGTCYAAVTEFAYFHVCTWKSISDPEVDSIHVATADFPQLQLIFKVVDIPVVTQRLADPHGPYWSAHH